MESEVDLELGGLGDRGIGFMPEDAFTSLVEVMGQFQSYLGELMTLQDEAYDPPNATMNVGKVRQGVGFTEAWFDFRTMPNQSVSEMKEALEERIAEVSRHYPMLNLSMSLEGALEGQDLGGQHEFLNECGEVMETSDLQPAMLKQSFSGEAGRYTSLGFDAFSFGVGDIKDGVYCPNESVDLKLAERAVTFYEKLIERVCL